MNIEIFDRLYLNNYIVQKILIRSWSTDLKTSASKKSGLLVNLLQKFNVDIS